MINSADVLIKVGYDVSEEFLIELEGVIQTDFDNDAYIRYEVERSVNTLGKSAVLVIVDEVETEYDDVSKQISEVESVYFDSDDVAEIIEKACEEAREFLEDKIKDAKDDFATNIESDVREAIARAAKKVPYVDPDFEKEYTAAIELGLGDEKATILAKAVTIKKFKDIDDHTFCV
jgi:hypothetical protein